MLRRRNDPDPLADRRKKLAEQERIIAQKLERISQGLDPDGPAPESKSSEPPVWRLEEDGHSAGPVEALPSRKRHLARQRQRDMMLFFMALGILVIVMTVVVWVAYVHNASNNTTGP